MRAHFSQSYSGTFPKYLETHQYDIDDDLNICYSKQSVIGQNVNVIDMRFWNVSDISKFFEGLPNVSHIRIGPRDNLTDVLNHLGYHYREKICGLSFEAGTILSDEDITIVSRFINLKSIVLAGVDSLLDEHIERIVHGKSIERIDVSRCKNLTDRSLGAIAVHCEKLSSLLICGNTHITNTGVTAVCFRRPTLLQLDISNCKKVDFLGLLIKHGDLLQYANRNWTSLNVSCCRLENESLVWIASALTELKILNLSSVLNVNNQIIDSLALNSPLLTHLNLANCSRVTNDSVSVLAKCCTKLIDINISCIGNITSDTITELIIFNPLLEKLDLSGNHGIRDGLFGDTMKKNRIKNLNVRATGLTSFGIACMAERCPLLKHLNISKLSRVDDSAIIVLSECCPYLESFMANDCFSITDEGLIRLSTRCRCLTTLSLASSKIKTDAWGGRFEQYTDDSIEAVLGCCKKLKTLILTNQYGIKLKSKWLLGRYNGSIMHEHALVVTSDPPSPSKAGGDDHSAGSGSKLTDSFASAEDQTKNTKHTSMVVSKKPKSKEELIKQLQNKVIRKDVKRRDVAISMIPAFKYTGGFAGHASLCTLDLTGVDDIFIDSTLYILSRCFCLEDVRFPFGTEFDESGYERKISRRDLRGEAFHKFSFRLTCYTEPGPEYDGLIPSKDQWTRRKYMFCDTLYRRIALERSSAAFIQKVFRIHRWYVIHRKIGCTIRIMKFYLMQKEKKKWWAEFNRFVINQRARCIQKYFRKNFLPFVRGTIILQRIVRGWFARVLSSNIKKLHLMATKIQKIARGLLVRISDRYIIAQIYMKLPPFWKSIVQSSPLQDTVCDIQFAQMTSLRQLTSDLKGEIEDSFKKRGKQIHGSVPDFVSQPFDRNPYVSTVDGRKISYYSTTTEGITTFANENPFSRDGNVDAFGSVKHRSVHPFNVKFWPLVEPIRSTEDAFNHDVHKDAFDQQGNYRYSLHCELCAKRLQMIFCKQCSRGYCFVCAFRAHLDKSKRLHHLEVVEPRVTASKSVSNTMLYHVDMAHRSLHDAKQLVSVMRNTAELKRIEQERKIAREMEEERIRQLIAMEKAKEEGEDRHNAVTLIASIFRGRKARKYCIQKKAQVMLEEALEEKRFASENAIKIQYNWRGHNCRKELQAAGFNPPSDKADQGNKKKRKRRMKKYLKEEMSDAQRLALRQAGVKRTTYELRQRRLLDRQSLFDKIFNKYLYTIQFLRAAAHSWISKESNRIKELKTFEEQKETAQKLHFELQKQAGALESSLTPAEQKVHAEYLAINIKVKQVFEKIKTLDVRMAVCKNIGDWAVMVVRSHLRRKSIIEKRFDDMEKRLHWIAIESFNVKRILSQLEYRKVKIGNKRSMGNVVRWIGKHAKLAELLDANLDAQQESILKDAFSRLASDEQNCVELESLAVELCNALEADSQLSAERSFLEVKTMESKPGSDAMVYFSEKLLKIKQRQLQLNVNVIDTIKSGLEDRFKREDDQSIGIAGFPTDDPEFAVSQMPAAIEAVLVDSFKPRSHMTIEDFFSVMYSQPWHSDDAVLDVRFEEKIQELKLSLDTLLTEAKHLNDIIASSQSKIAETKANLGELHAEIENIENGGEYEGELARDEVVAALRTELAFKENQLEVLQKDLDERQSLVEPNAKKSAMLSEELVKIQELLDQRLKERNSAIEEYFKIETAVNHDMEDIIRAELIKNENAIANINELCVFLEGSDGNDLPRRIILKQIELFEYSYLRVARQDGRFKEQIAMYKSKPSQNIQPLEFARMYINIQKRVAKSLNAVAQESRDLLLEEKKFVKKFVSQRKMFEDRMKVFMNSQLALRRQRSIAKEIIARRKRLEQLREGRLAAIKSAHDKEVAQQKAKEEAKIAAEKFKPPSLTVQLAQGVKQGLRSAADAYRRQTQGNANTLDPEEERMGRMLRKHVKAGKSVVAIRKIKITYDTEETELFTKQNNLLFSKSLPSYTKIARAINNEGNMFLWLETTNNSSDFITGIELSHSDPTHPLYRDLSKSGYESLSSPLSKMVVWIIREKRKSRGIGELKVCFDQAEENNLLLEGFEKVDVSLVNFNMPDIYLWIKKVNKLDTVESMNTNALIAEVKSVQKMMQERPNDEALKGLYQRLHQKLRAAHNTEKENENVNPLQYAIELLALSQKEMKKFITIFEKIDKSRKTRISLDDIFEWLEMPPTAFSHHVFKSVDALDSEGLLEFGDFMRSLSIYCFFGKEEILRFLYTFGDSSGSGSMSHEDFIKLLNTIHPYDKRRTKRALMELDLKAGKTMTFQEFKKIATELPNVFYPAFELQNELREKTMGANWWFEKLSKYKGVRKKLKATSVNADEAAEIEMERMEHDEKRRKRMEDRDLLIKATTSTVVKAILQARQFADEIS